MAVTGSSNRIKHVFSSVLDQLAASHQPRVQMVTAAGCHDASGAGAAGVGDALFAAFEAAAGGLATGALFGEIAQAFHRAAHRAEGFA